MQEQCGTIMSKEKQIQPQPIEEAASHRMKKVPIEEVMQLNQKAAGLIEYLKSAGFTQRDIANHIEVHQVYISRWLHDSLNISMEAYRRLEELEHAVREGRIERPEHQRVTRNLINIDSPKKFNLTTLVAKQKDRLFKKSGLIATVELLRLFGFTQQDIAQILSITQPAVSMYIRNDSAPVEVLVKLYDTISKLLDEQHPCSLDAYVQEVMTALQKDIREHNQDLHPE